MKHIHKDYLSVKWQGKGCAITLFEDESTLNYWQTINPLEKNYFLVSGLNTMPLEEENYDLKIVGQVDDMEKLIKSLKAVEGKVRSLILPTTQMCKSLLKNFDLNSLQYLSIEKGKFSIAKLLLPKLERLDVASAFFLKESLPNLKHYSGTLDKNLLSELVKYNDLSSVNIINPKISDLQEAFKLSANFLGIRGKGKLTSLENIHQINGVTSILIQDLNFDVDFNDLLKVEGLKELSVQYCNKLKNTDSLLNCKNLERLRFIGCDMRSHKESVALFEKSDLEFVRTGRI